MKLIAVLQSNSLTKEIKEIGVESISTWIGRECNHDVNSESIKNLLSDITKYTYLSVYTEGQFKGKIGANNMTPFYIYGEENVTKLILDEKIIFEKGKVLVT